MVDALPVRAAGGNLVMAHPEWSKVGGTTIHPHCGNVIDRASCGIKVTIKLPEVKGVWGFVYGGQPGPFTVIAIKQRYAGHSKQALLVAAGARAGAYGGKFVVVVDDDIDITNPADVIWAIATRCHVREDIDVVKGVWASVCEPALPPEERSPRGYTSDRVLIDACRPFKWLDQFPAVNAFTKDFKDKIAGKYKL